MQPPRPIVLINLSIDLESALRSKLAALNVAPSKTNSIQDLCLAYFNAANRRITALKRKVHYSRELTTKIPKLALDQQNAIKTIQITAERGQDLTCYLSTKIMKDYKDQLFNDWRILHFHLGMVQSGKPFSQRTNELLYAYATKNDLYLIDLLDHDPVSGFSNQGLLQIIDDNWSHITRPFALRGITAGPPITDSQVDQLRKSHISYSVSLRDGTLLFPLGGGYASSGDNSTLVMHMNKLFFEMREFENKIRSNPDNFISAIQREQGRRKTVFDIKQTVLHVNLINSPIGFEVIEMLSGCRLTGWEFDKNL